MRIRATMSHTNELIRKRLPASSKQLQNLITHSVQEIKTVVNETVRDIDGLLEDMENFSNASLARELVKVKQRLRWLIGMGVAVAEEGMEGGYEGSDGSEEDDGGESEEGDGSDTTSPLGKMRDPRSSGRQKEWDDSEGDTRTPIDVIKESLSVKYKDGVTINIVKSPKGGTFNGFYFDYNCTSSMKDYTKCEVFRISQIVDTDLPRTFTLSHVGSRVAISGTILFAAWPYQPTYSNITSAIKVYLVNKRWTDHVSKKVKTRK